MLKLLIVDDEELDRDGLKEQVYWEKYGVDCVETAKNGFDALRKIENYKPNIIITDIKMPGMSGTKLIEQVRKQIPDVKVIFVSGHDDFAYAKEAIKLGADSYILKPVETDELIENLCKVIDDCKLKETQINDIENMKIIVGKSKYALRERALLSIIYGTAGSEEINELEEYCEDISDARLFFTFLIEIDDFDMSFYNQVEEIDKMFEKAHSYLMDIRDTEFSLYPVKLDKKRYVVLVVIKDLINDEYKTSIEKYENKVLEDIKSNMNLSVTIAEGIYVNNLEDIYKAYNTCCDLLLQKTFLGNGTVLKNSASVETNIYTNKIYNRIDSELARCILNQDKNRMEHLIDFLFESIDNRKIHDSKYMQYICINIISRLEIILYEMDEEFHSVFGPGAYLLEKLMKFEAIGDIKKWLKDTFLALIDYQDKKTTKRNRKIVEIVKQYIEENYSKDISLKEISGRLYYSPNYLGFIIKEELGVGFSEYLIEYRMKKACELLKDQHLKVYEISEKVSYKNVTAFVKKFKEQYGVTPKEYREER